MNIVIDSISKRILRAGDCYFEIDPNTEILISSSFKFTKSIKETIWKYDEEQNIFIEDIVSVRKLEKINEIREKTEYEEGLGVPYNNFRFSITPSAKSNWLALVVASAGLTYPFSAPTGFESIYSFSSVNDVLAFFGASMVFLKYWEESNETLIIAVNSCMTVEQINAIEDNRTYPIV